MVLKKLLTAGLAALALALAAAAVLRLRPARIAEPPRVERVARGAGPLLAGAAEVPLRLPGPVPVAGFPRLRWMDQGTLDPVSVRALVLSEPGCSLALVSAEILLVPAELSRAVEEKVSDLGLDLVVVAATHTHSGPGGFWRNLAGERVATGPYDGRVFAALAERLAEAVRKAAAAREPALLSTARAELPALVYSRDDEAVDGRLLAMRLASASGRPLAEVLVFPAHATLMDVDNRRISGDWPGFLMRSRPGVALFFQGAVGDQSARIPGDGEMSPEIYGRAVAERVAALAFVPGDPRPPLVAAAASVLLPEPSPGFVPPVLRRLATNLLYDLVPARSRVAAVRLGPALLLAVPGEPVGLVARAWREGAGQGAEIVSLADDYVGYVETRENLARGNGETVRTYYGPELAERLGSAVLAAAAATGEPTAAKAP